MEEEAMFKWNTIVRNCFSRMRLLHLHLSWGWEIRDNSILASVQLVKNWSQMGLSFVTDVGWMAGLVAWDGGAMCPAI